MNSADLEKHLLSHGIKPTAVRIVVWRAIAHSSAPFTLKDVEEWQPYMDRSSIFRALRLFAEHQLLHEIDDGTGICKYCVCHCKNDYHTSHVHFVCTHCGQTLCLADTQIPHIPLPTNFAFIEAEYVIKGVCDKCNDKY